MTDQDVRNVEAWDPLRGAIIRRLRKRIGFTQEEFVRRVAQIEQGRAGLSRDELARIELGSRKPTRYQVRAIAEVVAEGARTVRRASLDGAGDELPSALLEEQLDHLLTLADAPLAIDLRQLCEHLTQEITFRHLLEEERGANVSGRLLEDLARLNALLIIAPEDESAVLLDYAFIRFDVWRELSSVASVIELNLMYVGAISYAIERGPPGLALRVLQATAERLNLSPELRVAFEDTARRATDPVVRRAMTKIRKAVKRRQQFGAKDRTKDRRKRGQHVSDSMGHKREHDRHSEAPRAEGG